MLKNKGKKIRALLCAAEAVPLAKVGGLADVVGSLPFALKKEGVDARIMMPAHRLISLRSLKAKHLSSFTVLIKGKKESVNIYEAKIGGAHFYLLQNKDYFAGEVYEGVSARKYLFFCRIAIRALEEIDFKPDVIHAHDFHAAPIIAELGALPRQKRPALILTIHNLRHQGHIPVTEAEDFGFRAADFPAPAISRNGGLNLNLLAAGIMRADKITTVSPNYAREILSAEYGCGLENILRLRRKDLIGILNGIDVVDYDPTKDERLATVIDYKNVSISKGVNKDAIRSFSGLEKNDSPLFVFIARFSAQKGLDLFDSEALAALNSRYPFQLIFLGMGEKKYEKMAIDISRETGRNTVTMVAFDETIAHNLYAAADYFLMPSLFEPCGLTQMIAMRYGAIPVVRSTGGLKDTVLVGKTGLMFKQYSAPALTSCLKKALSLYYRDKRGFEKMRRECISQDWSWSKSAPLYAKLYKHI